jgi:hypothetical protein
MEFLGCLVGLAMLAAMASAVWGCYRWVLGPLDRAAKSRQYPAQFSLADLLSLFVLVQLPFGVVHWAAQGGENLPAEVVVDLLVSIAVAAIWWTCVRTLSRAGIHVTWHRCVIIALVMPASFVGSVAAIILPFAALIEQNAVSFWLLLAEPLVIGVLYGLGRFTRYAVASAEARRNEAPPAPVSPESGGPSPPSLSA